MRALSCFSKPLAEEAEALPNRGRVTAGAGPLGRWTRSLEAERVGA